MNSAAADDGARPLVEVDDPDADVVVLLEALATGHDSRARWERATRAVMETLWQPTYRYTAPNRDVYPWQWLWDSCFHAMVWGELGDERAVTELETLFALQTDDGMVPHIGYQADPAVGERIWGNRGASTITQPPMFGHALRVLAGHGFAVEHLLEPATEALLFFGTHRRAASGRGVVIVHPWESGADDSPRWGGWLPGEFARDRWLAVKLELLAALQLSDAHAALGNPLFEVVSAGFAALVAFNCRELVELTGDQRLATLADELVDGLATMWNPDLPTWVDHLGDGAIASSVRTVDSLLPLLVEGNSAVVERAQGELMSSGFLEPYGLTGVHRDEPYFREDQYWRGVSWPPLMYLMWLAAARAGHEVIATDLAERARRGGAMSRLAEYYNPISGAGLGAQPQGWSCLPITIDGASFRAPDARR